MTNKVIRSHITFVLSATLIVIGVIVGCGGGGSGPSGGGSTSIFMTDAPLSGATAVTITIDKIEAHAAGGAFFNTGIGPLVGVNLLSLKNTEMLLGSTKLAPGMYTGLRLSISNSTITFGANTFPLVPVTGHGGDIHSEKHGADTSASADGKSATLIIAGPFTVAADGSSTPLLLDFNLARSVVRTGAGVYLLKPVIPVVHKDESGSIAGNVLLGPPFPPGADLDVDISVVRHGLTDEADDENGSVVDAATVGGGFIVHCLPAGAYDVTMTATGYTSIAVSNVIVTAGSTTDIGTTTLHRP